MRATHEYYYLHHDIGGNRLADSADQEVSDALTGEVNGEAAQVGALGVAQDRFARMTAERVHKLQRGQRRDGRHVDLVLTAGEVTDRVLRCPVGVGTGTEHENVRARAAPQESAPPPP